MPSDSAPQQQPQQQPRQQPREQEESARKNRAAHQAATAFRLAVLLALGLLVVYVRGGNAQVEGVLLALTFGSIGVGLALWVRRVIGPEVVVEDRYPMRSDDAARKAFEEAYEASLGEAAPGGRRRFLVRLLTAAGGTVTLALLAPLRSLGPGPKDELFTTAWRAGVRLVTADGVPLRPQDVRVDEIVTVFPEGAGTPADAQAVLVGTRPGRLDPAALPIPDGIVDGEVCYSKICTHAGCPVGLYRAAQGELLCPCHQSTFDVNRAAAVKSGPAGRALPQLPIGLDEDGYLIALGDFSAPAGPSFWNLTRDGDA